MGRSKVTFICLAKVDFEAPDFCNHTSTNEPKAKSNAKLTNHREAKSKTSDNPLRRKRFKREEREEQIVTEAIKLFAEAGFGAEMRELARRIEVNQSVIYRFFKNKEALIERVYQDVFITSWNPYWDEVLENRSVPLLDRLIDYYVQYSHNVISYEWVRIFLFAGLRGEDLNRRFVEYAKDRISTRVMREFRADLELPTEDDYRLSDWEFELVNGIHADIFYIGVRKFVYGISFPADLDQIVQAKIVSFYYGVRAAVEHYNGQRLD